MDRTTKMITAALPSLESLVKAQAYGLGFDLVGIARLGPAETAAAFDAWLAEGYAGEMTPWLERGAEKRRDFRRPVAGVLSAVVVAMSYGGREPAGPVARYARGVDYHDVMAERLRALHDGVRERVGRDVAGKAYVDTGPILERDLARRAGLGWFGKSTMLVNPTLGSFFFLGALLLDLELEPDAPFEADRCGTCTRCLDACPTGAFVAPRTLDATRCVSYLTIEARGGIPEALRDGVGDRIYGCDVCQDVCPYNRKFSIELFEDSPYAPRAALAGKDARSLALSLLSMSQAEFSASFKGSPMKRAKLRGLRRNASVVLGNVGAPDDIPALVAVLADDEPLVRGHAAWALGRIGSPAALQPLRERLSSEDDPGVAGELRSALAALGG
ncbi:tRNA epoxyqueuosine(34) reductase QueG [Gemmatirosa kalamazoonensis]|uniref:tRNA epoxyqueuosine(34) reductase QueG n=1 Tax=Gemmatirosa kalamazoonensis TaxID=861299 RepID=UPI001EFF8E48|nr:tRNA epoxyqueuosine(34) reductase QueG [Gemmatirosa kalamazoonensis]